MAEHDTTFPPTEGPPFAGETVRLERRVISLPWHRSLLAAILALSALLNFWDLNRLGYSNSYYAAAVRSMMQIWHNFVFASFDPGGFVTIDKPPVGFWFQVLSAKLFGYNGVSLLLPSALAGVLSVWLLYYLIDRRFGHTAGLVAALALAVTPVAVASNRSNIIDSILVLFLLLAAWAATMAAERGSLRWLLLCAVFVGIGFNIKMLEAYLPLPAFGLIYLLGAPRTWWIRLGHLVLAGVVLLAVSFSWAAAVDLTPAGQRPWVDSTHTNSELDLAIGYNGLQRLTGQVRFGGGGHGNRPPTSFDFQRIGQPGQSDQPDLPSTAAGTGTSTPGATQSGGTARSRVSAGGDGFAMPRQGTSTDRQFGDFNRNDSSPGGNRVGGFPGDGGGRGMFDNGNAGPLRLLSDSLGGQAGWLLPLAALGLLAEAIRRRPRFPLDEEHQGLVLWGAWLLSAGSFFSVAGFFHGYYLVTLAPAIAALSGIGVAALWRYYVNRGWRGWLLPAALLATAAVQVSMLQPYTDWSRWLSPVVLVLVIASAVVLVLGRLRRVVRLHRAIRLWTPLAATAGVLALLVVPTAWSAYTAMSGGGGMTPTAGPSVNSSFGFSQGGFGQGQGFGGFGGDTNVNSDLLSYLEKNQGTTKYLLAVQNSNSAASYIIQTGKPVMSLGGFSGSDPILTLDELQTLIKQNVVRFFMGVGGGGFGGGGDSSIGAWVQSSCKAVPESDYTGASSADVNGGPQGGGSFGGSVGSVGSVRSGFAGGGQIYDCAGAVH